MRKNGESRLKKPRLLNSLNGSAAKSLYKALELLGRGYQSERWFYIDNGYPLEKATIQEKLAQATGLR